MTLQQFLGKTITSMLFLALSTGYSIANNVGWGNAQWIWQQEDGPANTWVSFRKTVTLDAVPSAVEALISVDSKYWLWINGEMVILEGGFSRGPSQAGQWDRDANIMPTNSWYETVDITPYLKTGENSIAILVWYWGRMTHKGTHVDSKKGGLLFYSNMGSQTVESDDTWKAIQHPGYDNTIAAASKSLVQYSVKFNAQTNLNDWTDTAWYTNGYNDTPWPVAVEKGLPGVAPWYNLVENYVPRLIDHGLKDYENNADLNLPAVASTKTEFTGNLPFNKQITPYLEIEANAGDTIFITTDNRLNKITATYICKEGTQSFESFSWMNGHKVKYTIPAGVKVKALKYRWMSVGEMVGKYEVNDPFYQRLWEMGNYTLFVCARDNFMDCPDRERALWIGDVADQAGYLFYTMDNSGRQLMKKAILQTMFFSENKVLGALGPARVRELVGQSLQFIAQAVWPYYYNTGDTATLEIAYPYVYDYLTLFPMGSDGLPVYRRGKSPDSWDWLDWGVDGTLDKYPMQPAYYYQALVEAKKMAETLGKTEHLNFYTTRIKSIKDNYDKVFWKNGFYSSNASKFKDDRANALAILTGVADPKNHDAIVKNVLIPNRYSSPHFEWVAEEAMFMAGKPHASLERMKEVYESQVNSGLSTLYEKFPKGGSYNHAWNASNTILSKYVAGIKPTGVAWSNYSVCPNLVHMTSLKTIVPTVKGNILLEIYHTDSVFKLDLESPANTTAIIGVPKTRTEITEIKAGNQTIWKDNAFIEGVQGISYDSENDEFLKFKVEPGTWSIDATIIRTPIDRDPVISFSNPTRDTSLYEGYTMLNVAVNATDDLGIEKVDLYLNNGLLSTKNKEPFRWLSSEESSLTGLSLGKHTLKAIVTDTKGQTSETSIKINILQEGNKLSGKVFGTPDIFCRSGETVATLFDGNLNTALNSLTEAKNEAWAGIDFGKGAKKTISSLRFAIRVPTDPKNIGIMKSRLAGAKIYGTNNVTWDTTGNTNEVNADIEGNLLYEISAGDLINVNSREFVSVPVSSNSDKPFRYALIFFSSGSHGNCAEFEVHGGDGGNSGVNPETLNSDLNIYLRKNELCVDSEKEVPAIIEIYDISGALIEKQEILLFYGTNTIKISNPLIAKNMYVVKAQAGNMLKSQKIIR